MMKVIGKLPPPKCVKVVNSFLGHVGFYRRFMRDFSKIDKPLNNLIDTEAYFVFSNECLSDFK